MQPADRSHVDIPDEPTRGLHFADVHTLLEMLDRPVEQGNTVMVSGHNLDVIKTADRLIDLGSEGGEEGAALVVQGTPELVVAKADTSFTGRFLANIVKPAARRKRSGARAKVSAA